MMTESETRNNHLHQQHDEQQQLLLHRRLRRRHRRIDQEIDLYCNPFVEVYLRLSRHVRKVSRRFLFNLTDFVLEFQDNVFFRNALFVADYTLN